MKYVLLVLSFAIQFSLVHAVERSGYTVRNNLAQYKGSDFSNVVQVARGITLELAFEIADNNPDIDYFVYTKGQQMVLEIPRDVPFDPSNDIFGLATNVSFMYDNGEFGSGYCRVFQHGDVVFFHNKEMWLGSAPGLADTYIKD